MPRNLFERCEVVFPVRDAAARARIHDEILPALWPIRPRRVSSSRTGPTPRLRRSIKDGPPFSSQDFLMQLAEGKADLAAIPRSSASKTPASRPTRRAPKKAVAAD